jgi:hypothetical protein
MSVGRLSVGRLLAGRRSALEVHCDRVPVPVQIPCCSCWVLGEEFVIGQMRAAGLLHHQRNL